MVTEPVLLLRLRRPLEPVVLNTLPHEIQELAGLSLPASPMQI